MCVLCATDCPVFEIKAKINVSVPSGFINRPISTELYIKRILLLVHSVATTRVYDSTKISDKNQISNIWISWSNIANVVFFHCIKEMGWLSREFQYRYMFKYDMAVVFLHRFGTGCLFSTGIVNVNMLHDVQRVTFREIDTYNIKYCLYFIQITG